MPERRLRLLILGGTGEAAALARRIAVELGDRLEPITSLAGRLPHPPDLPGEIRIGGFGGAEGLGAYLQAGGIDLLIDATHPFAAVISSSAAKACDALGVPRLMLVRPAWQPQSGDRWLVVDSLEQAAALLPGRARRVFLATGSGSVQAFARLSDIWFLLRLFAPPATPPPLAHYTAIIARPPFSVADEQALLARHRIEALVCKNSGGPTAEKLAAARVAGIPVIMLQRQPLPDGETAEKVDAALDWLRHRL